MDFDALLTDARVVQRKLAPRARRKIVDLHLLELSVVDQPAVPLPGQSGNIVLMKRRQPFATFQVVKAETEQRYVLCAALIPDVVDLQGDTIDAETIRAAASDFLAKRQIGHQHKTMLDTNDAQLIDSFVTPEDMQIGSTPIVAGTWLVGLKLSPSLFASVKSGALLGVSIGGHASSEPTEKRANRAAFKQLMEKAETKNRLSRAVSKALSRPAGSR